MILKLNNNNNIKLPTENTIEERLVLVNQILADYPESFEYGENMFDTKFGQKIDNDRLVKIRLDILATYLVRHDLSTVQSKDIMSPYKQKVRVMQEIPFSQLGDGEDNISQINGWE